MRLLPRITILRLLLLAALPVAALVVRSWRREKHGREHPELAFKEFTRNDLPEGVGATAYASEMNDAPFRSTHYWMLSGPRQNLLSVPKNHGLVQTSLFAPDEAQYFQAKFGILDSKVKVTEHFCSGDDGTQDHLPMSLYYVLDNGTAFFVR